jgi:cyanophycinase
VDEGRAGPLALVGSGEFLSGMQETDRRLLAGRTPTVAVVPTAAAPEGDRRLRHWVDLARTHFEALGAEVVPLLVRDRSDANRDSFAAAVEDVGLVYLSGGDPGFLTETLRGTPVWEAIVAAWRGGSALAGCSAGAMALAGSWPPFSEPDAAAYRDGLSLVPQLAVLPHFDRVLRWRGGRLGGIGAGRPDGATLVGIDEHTAAVWRDGTWTVEGQGAVWGLDGEDPAELPRTGVPLPDPQLASAR